MYIIFHYKKSTHIWISPNSSRLCSISIIIFLFSFQALRQTRQQSRHLRIAKYFHQQFGIYSLRYGNLIFFSILSAFFRRSSSMIWPYTSVTMSACACPESPWTALISPSLSFSLYVTLVWRRLWKTSSCSFFISIRHCATNPGI